jgi:hypothetical protein
MIFHPPYPRQQRRIRRDRRYRRRGWRYRIPADVFRVKHGPAWRVKTITRRHPEKGRLPYAALLATTWTTPHQFADVAGLAPIGRSCHRTPRPRVTPARQHSPRFD